MPKQKKESYDFADPLYDQDDLFGILSKSHQTPFDVHEVIARIVDESNFEEFKSTIKTLVTGFAKIGFSIGIVEIMAFCLVKQL